MTDPLTGSVPSNALPYDYCVTFAGSGIGGSDCGATGTDKFPCQFSMSPQLAAVWNGNTSAPIVPDNDAARAYGYATVGTPTNACFAPFATMYHATASQGLSLSSYIKHPFLLEAVQFQVPFIARRIHHVDGIGIRTDNQQRRDMDSYVFFIYRQTRVTDPKFGKDSASDISGSIRNLVCSASMVFWNKPTVISGTSWNGGTPMPAADVNKWPLNSPAFSYDWNAQCDAVGNHVGGVDDFLGSYTGSLNVVVRPAVVPFQPLGASAFPAQVRSGGADIQMVSLFQNFWAGATTQLPFLVHSKSIVGKTGLSSSINNTDFSVTGYLTTKYSLYDPALTQPHFFGQAPKSFVIDGRSFRSVGSGRSGPDRTLAALGIYSNTSSRQSVPAPYLLMPTDELVFGIDAGISQYRNGANLGLTGSTIQLLAQEARVTLFGSLVREGHEYHDTLNPALTSMPVREAIRGEDVLDQFEVEPLTAFSGSYLDSVITGTLAAVSSSRGIVASAAGLSAGSTGSLLRAFVCRDFSEQYYDTIMPDIYQYLSQSKQLLTITEQDDGIMSLVMSTPITFFSERENNRMPFPYNNDIARVGGRDQRVRLKTDMTSSAYFSGSALRRALFKIGDHKRVDSAGVGYSVDVGQVLYDYGHARSGSQGFRYGIYNTEPDFPRVVFRFNRYGQLRDMLEQRPDTKFKKSLVRGIEGTVKSTFIGDSPIMVTFAGGDPYQTDSSNMSTEASSSLPYFDGVVRNREDPVTTSRLRLTQVQVI